MTRPDHTTNITLRYAARTRSHMLHHADDDGPIGRTSSKPNLGLYRLNAAIARAGRGASSESCSD